MKKKLLAEMAGTMVLVLMGCGAAMATHTGSNAVAAGVPLLGGLLAEVVFTMVFVLVVLGDESQEHPGIALMKESFFLGITKMIRTALQIAQPPEEKEGE